MSDFRAGTFDRGQMPGGLRRFSPSEALHSLEDVDLVSLQSDGKTLILLDVDNTLLPWRSHEVPPSTHDWISRARSLGFELCILSNTRNPERLEKLAGSMGVAFVRSKFKPSRKMYLIALDRYKREPQQAVMIGDQLLTDVLGANRSGIDAIWVKPMAKKEFVGTRLVSRNVERVIGWFLYRFFQATDSGRPEEPTRTGLFGHNVVRQFAKFIVVGGSSTVVDVGLHFFLMFFLKPGGTEFGTTFGRWLIGHFPGLFHWAVDPSAAAVPVLKILTASIAICNSFVWNRLWTFEIRGKEERGAQFRKFVVVSVIGMILNAGITTVLNNVIPGHRKWSLAAATAVATVIVAVWNFCGQKFWTFRSGAPSGTNVVG